VGLAIHMAAVDIGSEATMAKSSERCFDFKSFC
jgi:hypothetical protein